MELVTARITDAKEKPLHKQIRRIWKYKLLYVLLVPAFLWVLIFDYLPLYGVSIAFMDYNAIQGFSGSHWAGVKYFQMLFESEMFLNAFKNTLLISLYKMISGFLCPILLALALNEVRVAWFKKSLQTAVYLPRFVSWVVYGGIITLLLSPETGVINKIVAFFGGDPVYLLVEPAYFRTILVVTDAMKEMGWAAIIYIAAIAGLNPEVYEAAMMDGATRFQRIVHVTLPGITGTIIVIFILRVGYIMSAGLDQVINLYNPMVFEVGDILDTYIYRVGIEQFNLSLAAAADVIKGVIGLVLMVAANQIAKRFNDSGIF
ncbi:ABC transporter permease subunit [Paenibacillus chondroitinus]|uniref:ABC transporter permease subunit n=1 Tax=Paenibacillus chondroitinus TaxID=59842 RepID=A0ABU6D8N9_9BACL|nr:MULTISPECIES: ABC transporter permease subunit [Paenibacillus]MCY9659713.1 ABC transporter permease subunit [Paenibacillus anseongense]MEB4794108.1 ABC transporter permease subunit [Paenibacillus chondroitinus]